MAVNQGLKTFAENTPEVTNQGIDNLINLVNVGFVGKTRSIAQKIDASTVLIVGQKNALKDTMDTQPHLNIGRFIEDLAVHSTKILTGELGQQDLNDDRPNTGSFLDHIQAVQGFVGTIPFLYGYTADSINKGVAGHFGTVSGAVDTAMNTLQEAVAHLTARSDALADTQATKNAAYQTASQNIINFLNGLDDSTAFNESTFNSLQSAFVTAANEFDTTLQAGEYISFRTNMINSRKTIVDQIALEVSNLAVIRTYENTITELSSYVNLAADKDTRNLIIRTSNNKNFKEYFENYEQRNSLLNPLYTDVIDSSLDSKIEEILKIKGLPDVTDFQNIDAVAQKALRDDRLATVIKSQGKTSEQIIIDACDVLKIDKRNKDTFALSKSLLENLNNRDREVVKNEITTQQTIDTIS